jgi:hypothetical protein
MAGDDLEREMERIEARLDLLREMEELLKEMELIYDQKNKHIWQDHQKEWSQ